MDLEGARRRLYTNRGHACQLRRRRPPQLSRSRRQTRRWRRRSRRRRPRTRRPRRRRRRPRQRRPRRRPGRRRPQEGRRQDRRKGRGSRPQGQGRHQGRARARSRDGGRCRAPDAGSPQQRRAGDRRVARQGEDDQEVPRRRLRREGLGRPREGSAQEEDGDRHRARLSARVRGHRRRRRRCWRRSWRRRGTPSGCCWRPTPIAKGRPSPGTSPRRCARRTPTSSACSSTRSPRRRSTRRSASRWSSTSGSSSRSRRVACWTAWSATRSARCSGRRCGGACRRGACSRSPCGWSSSARRRSPPFGPRSTGPSRRVVEGSAPPPFTAKFAKLDGKRAELTNEGSAREVVDIIKSASLVVAGVERKERRKNPPPPFITSKLQQEASSKLRFSPKRTMGLAQRLYEGVEVGDDGLVGLITYMRTDSVRISDDAAAETRALHRRALRRHVPARRAGRLQEQEGGAGRARGDPADQSQVRSGDRAGRLGRRQGRRARRARERRSPAALHADLEPLRRLPDGGGDLRSDVDSTSAPAGSSCGPAVR